METKQLKITKSGLLSASDLKLATSLLQSGELVAFPTETVYGLGADATNTEAIKKIYLAKGRPSDNPLIAHVGSFEQLEEIVETVPAYVKELSHQFSPGPLTYILKHNEVCSNKVTSGLDTIAVRIPSHPVALQLLRACDFPVAAPSANLSGKPSPTSASHVLNDLTERIPLIIDGGPTGVGVESTVIDCIGEKPVVLRHGSVTEEMIAQALKITLNKNKQNEVQSPKSPGLKYKHYAPSIPLLLVKKSPDELKQVILSHRDAGKKVGVLLSDVTANRLKLKSDFDLGTSIEEIAGNLYTALRSFEHTNYDIIIIESFKEEGLGVAVMDRLTRAATEII